MKTTKPVMWMALSIDRIDSRIRVNARGCRGEEIPSRFIETDWDELARFAQQVETSARLGKALGESALAQAQSLQRALLGGDIGALLAQLREASAGRVLVRLVVHDPELHAIPWEALCAPGQALGFWGTSPDIFLVRGIMTNAPHKPCEISTAIRVLAIAPNDSVSVASLRQSLDSRISTNEIDWLEPLQGSAATAAAILDRLRRAPTPHIIHFIGHGGTENGLPALQVADDGDEENWLEVELLAQQLTATFRGQLRLVVLQACEGAKPTAFASAAEILARAGANAVVAHAWPVRASVAHACSTQLYRALTSAEAPSGNIAMAMNEARRGVFAAFDASVEALSPVLYLQGTDGQIFDFENAHSGRNTAMAPGVLAHPPQTDAAATNASGLEKKQLPSHPTLEPPRLALAPEVVPAEQPPNAQSQQAPSNTSPLRSQEKRSKTPHVIASLALLSALSAMGVALATRNNVTDRTTSPSTAPAATTSSSADRTVSAEVAAAPSQTPAAPSATVLADGATETSSSAAVPIGNVQMKNGSKCSKPTQCQSDFCVDGVCCDSGCPGTCKACSAARKGSGPDGVCGYIGVGRDPDNECPIAGERCDGKGKCSLYASEPARAVQSTVDKLKRTGTIKVLPK